MIFNKILQIALLLFKKNQRFQYKHCSAEGLIRKSVEIKISITLLGPIKILKKIEHQLFQTELRYASQQKDEFS